jgi:AraC family transcriptional activator of pyochelin receptor
MLPTRRDLIAVCLYVSREQLVDMFGVKVDNVPEPYRSLFGSRQGAAPVMELPMSPPAWMAVHDIVHCAFPEPLKGEYLDARACELLCHAVAEINKLRPCDQVGVAAETRERFKIEAAEMIYRREIGNPPSLDEVARRVGMNRNKLAAGFRERFDMTPHDFSREIRLRRGHDMLLSSALAVERVARACGYTSHAAFTRAFKEQFGYTPSAAKRTAGGSASNYVEA